MCDPVADSREVEAPQQHRAEQKALGRQPAHALRAYAHASPRVRALAECGNHALAYRAFLMGRAGLEPATLRLKDHFGGSPMFPSYPRICLTCRAFGQDRSPILHSFEPIFQPLLPHGCPMDWVGCLNEALRGQRADS